MSEIIKYKAVRLAGPEDELEQQLEDQSPWILATLLYQPRPDAEGPYLAIFYKIETD
jgi:hypothetical protein